VQAWRDKYGFNFWRPVIGVRRGDEDPITAPYAVRPLTSFHFVRELFHCLDASLKVVRDEALKNTLFV
jgi:hypothetical protein